MLSFKINIVGISNNELTGKYQKAISKTQYILDEQILKDSNYFIPMDTAYLQQSSLRASEIGKGRLRWDTPYARRLYYNPQYDFQTDVNPNASGLWFEKAKGLRSAEWERLANITFQENF